MAQPKTIEVQVLVDLSEVEDARRRCRRLVKDVQALNVQLARIEEKLIGLDGRLADYGIGLEVSS